MVPGPIGRDDPLGQFPYFGEALPQVERFSFELCHCSVQLLLVIQEYEALGREIIQELAGTGVEIGEVELQAGEAPLTLQSFPIPFETLAYGLVAGTQVPLAHGLGGARPSSGQSLASWTNGHLLDVRVGALSGRIEDTQGVDLVAEQLNADRRLGGWRENVHDPPPPAEGAGSFYHTHWFIAPGYPLLQKLAQSDPLPSTQGASRSTILLRGKGEEEKCPGGDHDQRRCSGREKGRKRRRGDIADQPLQRPQPPLNGCRTPGDALVGQGIGLGETQDSLRVWGPCPQFLIELLGPFRLASDEHHRPLQVVMEGRCHIRASRRQKVK